jgi:hypothetical protein
LPHAVRRRRGCRARCRHSRRAPGVRPA